jgi:hypothetical protein
MFIACICLTLPLTHNRSRHHALRSNSSPHLRPAPDPQDQVNALLANGNLRISTSAGVSRLRHAQRSCAHLRRTIHTAYLSPHLLSIDVRASWTGCAAYPNIGMTSPLPSISEGRSAQLALFFIDGFFESTGDKGSPITQLYLHHAELIPECNGIVTAAHQYILWLASQTGLMIRPALRMPHSPAQN